jgi:phosphoglycerol transferase
MSAPSPARPILWIQTVLVAMVAMLVAAGLFGRWSLEAWNQPHWLEGDPLEVYARVKLAGEQPAATLLGLGSVESLGAPGRADWTGYPVPDRIVFVLTGTLAALTGLMAAVQLMSAAIFGLNAASFFLCARWLRWRWEWAAGLALVFAFCTYNLRWGVTLSFSQTFTLPPLFLLCARCCHRGIALGWASRLLALGLALWLAQGQPYLAYFAGVVSGGALVLGLSRRIPRQRLTPLFWFLGALLTGFLACNARTIIHRFDAAETAPLVRSTSDLKTYALRPLEWLVPPADHRLPALGRIGRAYFDHREGHGEFFYNYLGVVGAVALAWLLGHTVRRMLRRPRRIPDAVLGLLWITAFGLAGGLNTWLGGAGLDIFRAATRIGIYAQVWVLLFLGGSLGRLLQHRIASHALALLLAGLAIWDQTPPLADPSTRQANHARWQEYATFTANLERALPAGAMVFQLPVTAFPESARIGTMPDYEHLLPYLTSRSLRYSYGHLADAPALRWSRHVGRLPGPQLVAALEQVGFAALWIDTRAYPDQATVLLQALRAGGYVEIAPATRPAPIRVFRLNPAPSPRVPDLADPRYQEPWDDPAAQPLLLALAGWHPLEQNQTGRWRWAARAATLGLLTEPAVSQATLRFKIGGPATSVVVVRRGEQELLRTAPGDKIHLLHLSPDSGLTQLTFQLEGATFRPGDHDPRELGFMVENLSVSVP